MAEVLATPISEYAFANDLNGDLAIHLSGILITGEDPLSIEERAWASSFNQKNRDCIIRHSKLHLLLNRDFVFKFKRPGKGGNSSGPARRQPN